jgi:hypothetical protein
MALDIEDAPGRHVILEAIDNARMRVDIWKRRAIYATLALAVSCAAVVPFLAGHSLHHYWDSFGKYLILVSMALLIVFVYCVGLYWGALSQVRELKRTYF